MTAEDATQRTAPDRSGRTASEQVVADHIATVRASLDAVSAGDVEAMLALVTDDFVLELPYADPPHDVEGKDAVREYLTQALGIFRMRMSVTAVHPCLDPDELVVQYASSGSVATTGREYANSYIGAYRFRGELICRHREFYNPLPAMRALEPV